MIVIPCVCACVCVCVCVCVCEDICLPPTRTRPTRNLSRLDSLLRRRIHSTIPGVNAPYLYMGMWRATFAWHVEDMVYSKPLCGFEGGPPMLEHSLPMVRELDARGSGTRGVDVNQHLTTHLVRQLGRTCTRSTFCTMAWKRSGIPQARPTANVSKTSPEAFFQTAPNPKPSTLNHMASSFRVQGSGCRVQGSGLRVERSGFRQS